MPLFQLDIEKRLGSEFWSNVYILNADGLATAQALSGPIIDAERELHADIVTLTRYRISSTVVGDGVYTIVPIGLLGQRPVSGVLPLFNTLRMDFSATTGRPSRKYYRGVLGEPDINGDAVVTSGFVDVSNDIFNLFATVEDPFGIVDPQGERLTAVVVWPFVQMRQLRRSRRRRENGGGIFQ